ncbi:hypothetical protein RJ639_030845 [Escallonia herrerae]|uniref:Mannan endo-1,4-beta-mannosidase n=1 Tax=Escallonia herrerae TaxID=1293975 RepID=A0AA89BNM6_9ASTE|nr:hypothetical protein RJ639_030845 [Escallonia herrerae]
MATHVKSLDRKHLLEIGMEGFYGDTMPQRKQINPGYQVGTDFISNNMIKEIDFATIHAYPDIWREHYMVTLYVKNFIDLEDLHRLSGQNDVAQMAFMQRWMSSHWDDSRRILKKPLVIAEFGKSSKDPGYSPDVRDSFMSTIYRSIYNFARGRGTLGGGLVWQLMAEGMESYYDGYEIVLSQSPSTGGVISRQSHAMTALSHLFSGPHNHPMSHAHGVINRHETLNQAHHRHALPKGKNGHAFRRRHGRKSDP